MSKQPPQRVKIDASKAMVIMGFKTSRTLEVANFDQRRQILDAQLFNRMQEVQVGSNCFSFKVCIVLLYQIHKILYHTFLVFLQTFCLKNRQKQQQQNIISMPDIKLNPMHSPSKPPEFAIKVVKVIATSLLIFVT